VCVEGRSGLLNAFLPGELEGYNASNAQLRLANGSRIWGYSADKPDRLRGSNLSGAWIDELCSMVHVQQLWAEALTPALRIGDRPRVFITTTPRPVPLLRELLARDDGSVLTVRGSTWDNEANLSKTALEEMRIRHQGTRLGRQELLGELIEDVEGALWTRELLEETRVAEPPEQLTRAVVGVDPAVTSGEHADSTGVVVAGLGRDGHLYVLADDTLKASPRTAMAKVVTAYHRWSADRIIGEVNNGGDYIEQVLRTVDEHAAYGQVRASRGKRVRAEPVAALFEQRRAHIVGAMVELEDELCSWVPDAPASPDRLDAMVWALTELTEGASALAYLNALADQRQQPQFSGLGF
jgi:phage terminase large subunit-like protein